MANTEVKALTSVKRVFICSPFRGTGRNETEKAVSYRENAKLAKKACFFAVLSGCIPYAPHLYYPRFLMDSDPEEREVGMLMGLAWLGQCSEIWIIGRIVSAGMAREIRKAKEWGIPVKHYVEERTTEERLLDVILHPEIEYHEMIMREE